jgi:CDP-diacylglycerol--glycerol-3-phosphate 3-phosphatidyltransferase
MATLYGAKPAFQALLRPVVGGLARAGITANEVTLAAAGLSLAYGAAMLAFPGPALLLGLPVVLALRMALNAVDGMLAREHGQATELGGRLNEVGDVVSDAALYLPLALVFSPAWLVVTAVFAGLAVETSGLACHAHGGERRHDGPFGKSDRAAFYSIAAVVQALMGLSEPAQAVLFGLVAILAILTAATRLTAETRHV